MIVSILRSLSPHFIWFIVFFFSPPLNVQLLSIYFRCQGGALRVNYQSLGSNHFGPVGCRGALRPLRAASEAYSFSV